MSGEIPKQIDMFSGEMVDTRTAAQRRLEPQAVQPRQVEMFSQREIAQFGVKARPFMPLTTKTPLGLEREDNRTEEEKERDLRREAEAQMQPMFSACTALVVYTPPEMSITLYRPKSELTKDYTDLSLDEDWFVFHQASALRYAFTMF